MNRAFPRTATALALLLLSCAHAKPEAAQVAATPAGEDATVVSISGLGERAREMIALLADVALQPIVGIVEWNRGGA
ncbi:MAG: hypothetical protein NVS4B10_02640 [Myxococcales bacterium]